jgi:predicted NBD/HSP70 family sugar kinase
MEVNVDFCGLRVLDLTRTVVAEWIERVDLRDSDPAETLGRLFRAALRIAADVERQGMRIIGTSLALPGLADHPQGPLRLAPNLGWPETDIRSLAEAAVAASDNGLTETGRLRAHQGMVEHLTVDNEANLAARAEALHQGVAGQNRSFIYLSGAIGIGAALVINGEVFRGLHGWAGEIGHTVVDPEGPLCVCGAKGCLEQYAGKRAILRAAGLPLDGGLDALVADSAKGSCATALKEAARALGIALAGAVNLVDITETVIGGDLTPLTEYLADGILSELGNHVVSARWIHPDMIVRPALSGPYPAMTGGAWHALSLVIADPASLLT